MVATSKLKKVTKLYMILKIALLLLVVPVLASSYGNSDLGYGNDFYTRYNNQYHGAYGIYGGPGNAYVRGSAYLNAYYSPGYSPRYGQLRVQANDQFSPGFQPRYGVVQSGVTQLAYSPGYTDERYGLTGLSYTGGSQYSPGYSPRYGAVRVAAGGPSAYYPYTYPFGPRAYYGG
jgi:hypothetical protein